MAAIRLEDLSTDEREARIKRLSPWVREYIAELIDEVEELKDGAEEGESFDDSLAATWMHLAYMRVASGDQAGATRAFSAARVFRSP